MNLRNVREWTRDDAGAWVTLGIIVAALAGIIVTLVWWVR